MATKLTDSKIAGLKPPAKGQAEYSDSKVPGLRLRVGKSSKTFILRKRVNGKAKNITLGRYPALSLAKARTSARTTINDIETTGVVVDLPNSSGDTIQALWPAFEAAKSHLRSIDTVRAIFRNQILPKLGGRKADTLKRSEITRFIDGIEKPIMARLVLAQLSSFYSWAMPRLDNLEYNPCRDAGKPPKSKKRTRALTEREIRALWKALDSEPWPWQQGVKLLIVTGQRRNEVFAADRAEFDFERRQWTIPSDRAKNDKTHIVPLSELALQVIHSTPEFDDSEKLFPAHQSPKNGPTGYSKAVNRIRKNLELEMGEPVPHWTLHDLRRTVATGFQRLGIRFEVTEAVLNHVSGSKGGIAGVYQTHDWADEKRTALDAWAVELERIASASEGQDYGHSNVVPIKRPV